MFEKSLKQRKIYTWYLPSLSKIMLLRGNCTVETKVALSYIFVPVAFTRDKLIKVIDNKQDPYQEPSSEQPSCQCHASYENYVGYQQEPIDMAQLPSITSICVYIWVGFSPVLESALLQLSFKTWKNLLLISWAGWCWESHLTTTGVSGQRPCSIWHPPYGYRQHL